jgi:hypothetical protein
LMLVFLVVPIVVIIGGRMVSRGRRWGMGLTAAIISILVGGLSLIFTLAFTVWTAMVWLGVGVATAQGAGNAVGTYAVLISCATDILAGVVAFCGIVAGIVAMRTLFKGDVKKTFN